MEVCASLIIDLELLTLDGSRDRGEPIACVVRVRALAHHWPDMMTKSPSSFSMNYERAVEAYSLEMAASSTRREAPPRMFVQI